VGSPKFIGIICFCTWLLSWFHRSYQEDLRIHLF